MDLEKELEFSLITTEIESVRANDLHEQVKELTEICSEAREIIKVLLYLIEDVLLNEIEDDQLIMFIQERIDMLNLD
jgi:hypothetical protein